MIRFLRGCCAAGYNQTGPDFRDKTSWYPNTRNPGTLFYHDHAACITRLNVYGECYLGYTYCRCA